MHFHSKVLGPLNLITFLRGFGFKWMLARITLNPCSLPTSESFHGKGTRMTSVSDCSHLKTKPPILWDKVKEDTGRGPHVNQCLLRFWVSFLLFAFWLPHSIKMVHIRLFLGFSKGLPTYFHRLFVSWYQDLPTLLTKLIRERWMEQQQSLGRKGILLPSSRKTVWVVCMLPRWMTPMASFTEVAMILRGRTILSLLPVLAPLHSFNLA